MARILNVGGKQVDLSGVVPFKIKAWRVLKEKFGITPGNIQEKLNDDIGLGADIVFIVGEALFQAAGVSLEDLYELQPNDLGRVLGEEGDVDRPSSNSSMSSQPPTAGDAQS